MAELFGSDFTLVGAVLAGLALTFLGILRDLNAFHIHEAQTANVSTQEP